MCLPLGLRRLDAYSHGGYASTEWTVKTGRGGAAEKTMKILVAIKQILDPELPARDFAVDPVRREAARGSASLILNIFCANALETALQFRERHGGSVGALSFGPPAAEDVLRKALAMTADDAVLVVRDEEARPDPMAVARVLAAAVRKRGEIDLVLTGRESGDWGYGQTGGLLAEELGWPCVGFVDQIEPGPAPGVVCLRRQTEEGWERLEASVPLVVTITNHERNVPRIPKTRDVMQSYRKPLLRWTPAELGLGADVLRPGSYADVVDLSIPGKEGACEFITGETLEERIDAFARRVVGVLQSR
jgi:electron transfer flavoprotein beta subunit